MGTLKIHHLMTKVQDSKTGRKKKQTRSSLPKLLRFDMGSINVSDSHDFLGTVATNVYWECVCGFVGVAGGYGDLFARTTYFILFLVNKGRGTNAEL